MKGSSRARVNCCPAFQHHGKIRGQKKKEGYSQVCSEVSPPGHLPALVLGLRQADMRVEGQAYEQSRQEAEGQGMIRNKDVLPKTSNHVPQSMVTSSS